MWEKQGTRLPSESENEGKVKNVDAAFFDPRECSWGGRCNLGERGPAIRRALSMLFVPILPGG